MTNHPIPGHMNFLPSKEDINEKEWLMESSARQCPYMRNLGLSRVDACKPMLRRPLYIMPVIEFTAGIECYKPNEGVANPS